LGLSGRIPRRVDQAAKAGLLDLIDRAVKEGWDHRRVCRTLELAETRTWRWRARRAADRLSDLPVGGHPVHGLRPDEEAEIVALFEEWVRLTALTASSRTAAPTFTGCGSHPLPFAVFWLLTGLRCAARNPPGTSTRKPFPAWVTYTRNQIWIYDTTHFRGCDGIGATAVMDLVTRKWLATIVSAEETSTQVQVVFTDALEAEGLLDKALERGLGGLIDPTVDDERRPILLAVSDNGRR
jgi:putative transposase